MKFHHWVLFIVNNQY